MLRTIGAVLLGYAVMFLVVFLLMSGAFLGLGAERAFQPGSYQVSGLWTVISIAIGLVAAVAGGMATAKVGRARRDPLVLGGVVVVLGLLMAIPTLSPPEGGTPAVRDASVGNLQAMQRAQPPAWLAFLNPVIGAAGVFIGARRVRGREGRSAPGLA